MGDKIQTVPYDNTAFDSNNGQTTSPQDLSCSSSSPCCWKNAQPPYSTVDWVRGSGKIDAKKFKKNFGTTEQPAGDNFLIASMDKGSEDSNKAELQSCLIKCSSGNVQVSLKHWTKGTKIRVCQVAQSNPTQLMACQDLPDSGPGPDTVDLPPADNVYIVVDAYNFADKTNNVAIVQDLTASYTPCQSRHLNRKSTIA
uniref:Ig-like domain-containing protein n=1 Tax=Romanomermis culicivorax TaxID=13658 RepID=A0A915JVM8_ROMCU